MGSHAAAFPASCDSCPRADAEPINTSAQSARAAWLQEDDGLR